MAARAARRAVREARPRCTQFPPAPAVLGFLSRGGGGVRRPLAPGTFACCRFTRLLYEALGTDSVPKQFPGCCLYENPPAVLIHCSYRRLIKYSFLVWHSQDTPSLQALSAGFFLSCCFCFFTASPIFQCLSSLFPPDVHFICTFLCWGSSAAHSIPGAVSLIYMVA